MSGAVLNLGSSLTTEIAGKAGFDWIFIHLEHGTGDRWCIQETRRQAVICENPAQTIFGG